MPFILYTVSRSGKSRKYSRVKTVTVAGKSGVLAQFHANANSDGRCPFPWHATCQDLVGLVPNATSEDQIVIDLKPNVADNVSLYRLLDVWGHSSAQWTPLAIRLQVLFADHHERNPKKFKEQFTVEAEGSFVGEFLYVQGGVQGGTWNWGKVGMVNGALLWPEAFGFLGIELAKALGHRISILSE